MRLLSFLGAIMMLTACQSNSAPQSPVATRPVESETSIVRCKRTYGNGMLAELSVNRRTLQYTVSVTNTSAVYILVYDTFSDRSLFYPGSRIGPASVLLRNSAGSVVSIAPDGHSGWWSSLLLSDSTDVVKSRSISPGETVSGTFNLEKVASGLRGVDPQLFGVQITVAAPISPDEAQQVDYILQTPPFTRLP